MEDGIANSGGALTDNKTFGELVGDKTVIGFEVLPTEGTVAGTPNFIVVLQTFLERIQFFLSRMRMLGTLQQWANEKGVIFMSYNPTTWQNGDIITADKLNKLEGGVSALTPSIAFHLAFTKSNSTWTLTDNPDNITFETLKNAADTGLVLLAMVKLTYQADNEVIVTIPMDINKTFAIGTHFTTSASPDELTLDIDELVINNKSQIVMNSYGGQIAWTS